MLLDLLKEWPVDMTRSMVVGDKDIDMDAARSAGIRGVRFADGNLVDLIERVLSETPAAGS
jgi:D-glycero-D-manno-heptose 1,7-bisphosphate phosphatase